MKKLKIVRSDDDFYMLKIKLEGVNMRKWICFIIALLGFGIIAYLVMMDKTTFFDRFIYNVVTISKNDVLTFFYKFITFFASEVMIILVCLMFFLLFKNKKFGMLVSANAILIFILNVGLKLIFMRERPFELMIITEDGYSFPSGHAMASLGFYGFIIYLIWNMKCKKKFKVLTTVLLSFLIILIGISRIYLGVHYASDVLAGYLVSVAYLIVYVQWAKRFLRKGVTND